MLQYSSRAVRHHEQERNSRRFATAIAAIALLAPSAGSAGRDREPLLECRTARRAAQGSYVQRAAPTPGTLLLVLQDPPVVDPTFKGRIKLDLAVLGDFEEILFEIQTFTELTRLTAERRGTHVNPRGDVLSFFEISGSLEEWLVLPWSWDVDITAPYLFSELLYLGPAGSEQPIFMPLTILPRNVPRSQVKRRGTDFQYASNVVNLAVPDLHQRQLDQPGFLGFSVPETMDALREKLGEFPYDEVGFGLWQHELTNGGAFHSDGAPGTPLLPHSVYTSSAFYQYGLWKHEVSHNWNFHYDLPALVGWQQPFDGFHGRNTAAPDSGLLCCSRYPVERVRGKWRTRWIRDPHPFHPLELFAMGMIDVSEVPDTIVFKRQDLPDYAPNQVMSGPTRTLSVDQVIAAYGMPPTATQNTWHVLPVVVSEELLPKKVLSALNFFMRRIEDPDHDVPASFDASSRYLMDLRTTVETSQLRIPKPPRDVTFPTLGKREIPGLVLSRNLPGCLRPGDTLILAGRTTTGDIPELALVPSNPDFPTLEAPPQLAPRFHVELVPTEEDVYQVRVENVWPRREPLPVLVGPIYVTRDCP